MNTMNNMAGIFFKTVPPSDLPAKVLTKEQRNIIQLAARTELQFAIDNPLRPTVDLANFCMLLAKPENHIKVRSNQ